MRERVVVGGGGRGRERWEGGGGRVGVERDGEGGEILGNILKKPMRLLLHKLSSEFFFLSLLLNDEATKL